MVITKEQVVLLNDIRDTLFFYPAMYCDEYDVFPEDKAKAFEYMIDHGGSLYWTARLRCDLDKFLGEIERDHYDNPGRDTSRTGVSG